MVLVAMSLAVVLAWWWPGLTGRGARSEVTVIGTGEISDAREVLSRRIREVGLSVQWVESVTTWCDVSALLDEGDTGVLVLAPDELESCTAGGKIVDAANISSRQARRLVLVALEPSSTVASLEERGGRRVVVERLIGDVDEPMPCVWWDECPSSGTVVTRTKIGLTDAGRQRLARMIAALVP